MKNKARNELSEVIFLIPINPNVIVCPLNLPSYLSTPVKPGIPLQQVAAVKDNPSFYGIKGGRWADQSILHALPHLAAKGDVSGSHVCQHIHQLQVHLNENLNIHVRSFKCCDSFFIDDLKQ